MQKHDPKIASALAEWFRDTLTVGQILAIAAKSRKG